LLVPRLLPTCLPFLAQGYWAPKAGLSPEVIRIVLAALTVIVLCAFTCVLMLWCVSRLCTRWAIQST